MKARRYILSVYGAISENDNEIIDAIYDALQREAEDNDNSAIYYCSFMVNPYK